MNARKIPIYGFAPTCGNTGHCPDIGRAQHHTTHQRAKRPLMIRQGVVRDKAIASREVLPREKSRASARQPKRRRRKSTFRICGISNGNQYRDTIAARDFGRKLTGILEKIWKSLPDSNNCGMYSSRKFSTKKL